jgi:phage terminase large subunit-like protein
VYAGAAARQQAGIVMGQSRAMALRSPRLQDHLLVRRYYLECPGNGGIMRALSSDGALQHGLNPSWSIIDELHAHKNPDLYTALTTGTGAREQPMTLSITTAGIAEEGILGALYAQIMAGPGEIEKRPGLTIYRDRDAGFLGWWYGADPDDDIEDPAVWLRANPASWLQDGRYLRQQFTRMKSRGQLLDWNRYHLNRMVGVEDQWLPEQAWAKCLGSDALRSDLPIGVGLDKGQTGDLSAVVIAQRQGDKVVVRARVFPPNSATGHVNTEAIREYLRELRKKYPMAAVRDDKTKRPMPGPAFAYDRWAFSESAETLDDEGLNMVDFPQYASTMGPASTTTYELITTGRLVHDGDPVLAEHVRNTTAVLTERGMKVTKPKKVTPRKNDACVAMVMAVAMAMQEAPVPREKPKARAMSF